MAPLGPISPSGRSPLLQWAAKQTDVIRQHLRDDGVLWLRSPLDDDTGVVEKLLTVLGAELMDEVFFSTPRSAVGGKTFTATEYPSDQRIPLHSEMSYLTRYPRLLCFQARTCPPIGGQTTVGDLDAISVDLRDVTAEFLERGVRYVRVFQPGVDIPIEIAFGTADLDEIAVIAAGHGMELEVGPEGPPRLSHVAQGALRDEATGDPVWFNQLSIHHPARLPATTLQALTDIYGADGLPRQMTFGDGGPIPQSTVEHVQDVLRRHTQLIEWEPGDVVLIDNLRYMHGREPYSGARTIHVAMGMPESGTARQPLFAETTRTRG
ncbi:TauD/TfdA family dioxygenase [Micromonospora sp. WMMA1976]|uniref:TauD/TfdA family dioxygenase n=1 Tax=Micromonospora sp. WMMA1976 TaxID=3014995 RepID=UPI00248CC705|nr:TauD/TfdA family dioxygenase [Micromonospora sp. WMMA1976]WBC01098.1 TauD/TfdA family dioxygenase [Micromonospora sp. WMMA1976]